MYEHNDLVHSSFPKEGANQQNIPTRMAGDLVYKPGISDNMAGAIGQHRNEEVSKSGEGTLSTNNIEVMPDIDERVKNVMRNK